MENKKKSPAVLKIGVGVLAVIDLLLIAGIVIVLLTGGVSGGGRSTLSDKFVDNSEDYFENGGEEITPDEDTISIKNNNAAQPTATVAPSTVPGGVDAQGADANGFIFPESSTKAITNEQMAAKLINNDACRHAINEIYARHGYQFTNQEILAYFNQFDWYKNTAKEPNMDIVDDMFSSVEKANVEKIQKYKTSKGW